MDRAKEVKSDEASQRPPTRDLALLVVTVVLMLGGAVTLVGGWIAAGIAIPVITVGIALVVIERGDVRVSTPSAFPARSDCSGRATPQKRNFLRLRQCAGMSLEERAASGGSMPVLGIGWIGKPWTSQAAGGREAS
jgi:hypothetical protein